MTKVSYLDAGTLSARLAYPELIAGLKSAFQRSIEAPLRPNFRFDTDSESRELLLMPAWDRNGHGDTGVKLLTIHPGNAKRGVESINGVYCLFDGNTGVPKAVMDAAELTARRTAAASALASSYLSRADSNSLLVVGAGKLCPYLIEAHCAVRPIETIQIWARNPDQAQAAISRIAPEIFKERSVNITTEIADACRHADLISCATRSSEPLIHGKWLSKGCHVDLVGGYRPDMREADDDCVTRATLFADTFEGVLAEAGDFVIPLENSAIQTSDIVAEMADLVTARHAGRSDDTEITLFKSVGTAIEDLAAAELAVEN